MMAAGWDGSDMSHAPGFLHADWAAKYDGILPWF
jgi:hypothetical protein